MWSTIAPTVLFRDADMLLRGGAWNRGSASFSVHWPPKPFRLPDSNMLSMILRVQWQDRELWLMGDALGIQERDLLDLGDPPVSTSHRLLKPGHHGSASASDPAWLAALKPEVVVVTAGKNNRFGFPDPETLERYRAFHARATWIVGPVSGVKVDAVPGGWKASFGDGSEEWIRFGGQIHGD
jgi:competence protein ComEC